MDTPEEDPQLDPALVRQMDALTRREMESAEHQAAELAARRRDLSDVAWEAVQSGQRVTVRIGDFEVTGLAIYARNDLMTLDTAFGLVEVQIPNVDSVGVESQGSLKGRTNPHEAESFIARASLLQLSHEEVEIVTVGSISRFVGAVETVAKDHLALRGSGGLVHVNLAAIACIIRRPHTGQR